MDTHTKRTQTHTQITVLTSRVCRVSPALMATTNARLLYKQALPVRGPWNMLGREGGRDEEKGGGESRQDA